MKEEVEDVEAERDQEKDLMRRNSVGTLKKAWMRPLLPKEELAMEEIGGRKQMIILATSRLASHHLWEKVIPKLTWSGKKRWR